LSRDSRRSQEENESKRGEKKARHIEKEKQVSQMPKHSAACSVYWGIGDLWGGFCLGASAKVNKAKSGNASEIIPQQLGSSN